MKLSEGLNISASEIKNIVFDWGGVITDIHVDRSISAFQKLGFRNFRESLTHAEIQDLFLRIELGKIDEPTFLAAFRKYLYPHVTDAQMLEAWNAVLGDLPAERWALLEKVRHGYRTFLLSNTNSLHITYYFRMLEERYGTAGFNHLFEKTYFSHMLGMRKPNCDIFEFVVNDSRLEPSETLFIDDTADNIETARQLGINVYHLQPPETLTDLFC